MAGRQGIKNKPQGIGSSFDSCQCVFQAGYAADFDFDHEKKPYHGGTETRRKTRKPNSSR
jgi:hypothetical protein